MLRFILIMTLALEIHSESIQKDVAEYFESANVRQIQNKWAIFQAPLQNAIVAALKDSFGYRSMNVLIRKIRHPRMVAVGYLHDDNQVQLLLTNMYLECLPYLYMPEVNFALPDNSLKIKATLSKMILRSKYVVFRNETDMIQDAEQQALKSNSPFTYEQVARDGDVAMSVDGCILSASVITMLNGPSVNLGLPSFKLTKCRFVLEIFKQGSSAPPVIVDYDPTNIRPNIDITDLILIPLQEEMMPKLQSAVFSYINTTALFRDSLPNILKEQERVFRACWSYLDKVAGNLNKLTLQDNLGNIHMEDFHLTWADNIKNEDGNKNIYLSDMVLSGMESLHISHSGGPHKDDDGMAILEQYTFSSVQVSGHMSFSGNKTEYDFAIVMKDLTVDVDLNLEQKTSSRQGGKSKSVRKAEVTGWRSVIFYTPTLSFPYTEALIVGHMYNLVPSYVVTHLVKLISKAVDYADRNEYIKTNIADNDVTGDLKCPFGVHCKKQSSDTDHKNTKNSEEKKVDLDFNFGLGLIFGDIHIESD